MSHQSLFKTHPQTTGLDHGKGHFYCTIVNVLVEA